MSVNETPGLESDPVVLSVRALRSPPGALHVHLSCSHTLLCRGGDWGLQRGWPHPCEACARGESTIVEIVQTPDLRGACVAHLDCSDHEHGLHGALVRYTDEITHANAAEALTGTTLLCRHCHPERF